MKMAETKTQNLAGHHHQITTQKGSWMPRFSARRQNRAICYSRVIRVSHKLEERKIEVLRHLNGRFVIECGSR